MTGTWWEWCSASQSLPGYNQCFAVDCICLVLDLITGFLQNLSQTDLFNVTTEGTGTWVARQMWVSALSLNWKQMSHVSQLPWPETGSGHSISNFFQLQGCWWCIWAEVLLPGLIQTHKTSLLFCQGKRMGLVNSCDISGGAGGKIDRGRSVCCLKESQVARHGDSGSSVTFLNTF